MTPGCDEVLGCVDENASNYDANATAQAYDQYGNLSCIYASCDDIPVWGCIYIDGFGPFDSDFNAALCATYGGISCEEPIPGCTDVTACNYTSGSDGSVACEFNDCAGVCGGDAVDTDGDGICDVNEVVGCTQIKQHVTIMQMLQTL